MNITIKTSLKEQQRIDTLQPYTQRKDGKVIPNREFEKVYGTSVDKWVKDAKEAKMGANQEGIIREAEERSRYNSDRSKRKYYT